jgi:outer membrane protein assembly factor BamD (BamD/ComL family)
VADGAVPDAGAAGERGTLRAELRIIAAARRALDGNLLTQAATALAQHAARFPRGQLLQEREALQVLLACRGDDPAQAQSLLTRFTSDWPGSAFLGKLRAACR